jgi:hypothetical protein
MASKGTQVVMGSSTELPGSSAPTERPIYPSARHPPGLSQLAAGGTAARGSANETEDHPGEAALYGGAPPAPPLRTPRSN